MDLAKATHKNEHLKRRFSFGESVDVKVKCLGEWVQRQVILLSDPEDNKMAEFSKSTGNGLEIGIPTLRKPLARKIGKDIDRS